MNPIEAENLTRSFGAARAVEEASFEVRRGTVFGLLGRNGAGKSTLIKMLAGHLEPSAGRAMVLGYEVAKPVPVRWQRMGYVSQNRHLPEWMTGAECIEFARSFRPRWDQGFTLGLARRLQVRLDQRVGTLSRGHYVRLQTCVALGHHPELLLLDEPTAGLDPEGRRELLTILIEEIGRAECAAVMSSHLVEDLERMADRVAILDGGRMLACGAPEELQRSRCRIALPAAAGELRGVPGLVEWKRDGGAAIAITNEPEDALAYLRARGLDTTSYTVPSMQQVFFDFIPRSS